MDEELKKIHGEKERWEKTTLQQTLDKLPERTDIFQTGSGLPVNRLYTPLDLSGNDFRQDIGFPGDYPYTRGPYATMYRGRLWTVRQIAGFGTAKDTNRRYKHLLEKGQTGLSTDFDFPTLVGYDSDHPMARNEVGRIGVAVDSLKDMEDLFEGIPLREISVSMTINHPAPILMAMYIVNAEKQGIRLDLLDGTLQNDPLKEFFAQKSYIFPPRASLKLLVDSLEYGVKNLPKWKMVSICGGHMREAGASAIQELAFTLADGVTYVDAALKRGIDVDHLAPTLSFLFNSHNDFFEEIAKLRAGRRIWAKLMKERFGAKNPESCLLRTHVQTGCATLTAQQPEVNIIRGTIQALAGVLGGAQSMHVNGLDEALSIPTEKAMTIAIRTQQVIAYESGVTNTVDPFGGSYFVESLTDRMEEEVWGFLDRIEAQGGMIACIENGYIEKLIVDEAFRKQREIESKKSIVVGVNEFVIEEGKDTLETFRVSPEIETEQIDCLRTLRKNRNNEEVNRRLQRVREAALEDANVMVPIIEAVKVYATEGEIIQELKEVYGEYKPQWVF
jgi:methylmalonyl-CoA mutase N-terminal domain/subunit